MYDAIPGSKFQSTIMLWDLVTLFCEKGCDAYSRQMKLGHSEGKCVINLYFPSEEGGIKKTSLWMTAYLNILESHV